MERDDGLQTGIDQVISRPFDNENNFFPPSLTLEYEEFFFFFFLYVFFLCSFFVHRAWITLGRGKCIGSITLHQVASPRPSCLSLLHLSFAAKLSSEEDLGGKDAGRPDGGLLLESFP